MGIKRSPVRTAGGIDGPRLGKYPSPTPTLKAGKVKGGEPKKLAKRG